MNKTFYDFIRKQIAAIRVMLFSLRESTIKTLGYDNAAELERLLFDAINALVDFEIILEKINENKLEKEKDKVLELLKARQSKSRIVYTFGKINELSKEEMDLIDHINHSWGVDLLNETLEDDENKLEKEKENEIR